MTRFEEHHRQCPACGCDYGSDAVTPAEKAVLLYDDEEAVERLTEALYAAQGDPATPFQQQGEGTQRLWRTRAEAILAALRGSASEADEPTPTCDICGRPENCSREDCHIHAGDWNGETGNHLSCEAHQRRNN